MDATRSRRSINRRAAAGVAACAALMTIAFAVGRCTAPAAAGLEPTVVGFSADDIGPGADFTTTAGAVVVEVGAYIDSITTTTTTPPPVRAAGPVSDDCWIGLARTIGWPEHTLGTLQHIIQRESGCNPDAYADRPSTLDNSRGLLQINAYGSLADGIRRLCGIEPETLFDPAVNLTCGLTYWQSMGWRPWGMA